MSQNQLMNNNLTLAFQLTLTTASHKSDVFISTYVYILLL